MPGANGGPPDSASGDPVTGRERGTDGHPPDSVARGTVEQAEAVAAKLSTQDAPMGRLGPRFNWRSPFFIGLAATAGVAVTLVVLWLFWIAADVFLLIGVALFLAVGMDPAVSFLVKRRFPRWLAVIIVLVLIAAAIGGFIAAAVPVLITQGEDLVNAVPQLLQQVQDHNSFVGQLNDRFQVQQKIESLLADSGSTIAGGVLGAGEAIFGAVADFLIIIILTIYFLADMPRIRGLFYRLVPHSRRPRAILIGDDIMAKVGGYVLGNIVISIIAGVLAFAWLAVTGVPYALLLALLVAILDVVPVVGSTIAGIVVAAVALTVSLPICLATIGFFILYRFLEDYFLVPKIIGKAVDVPALVTVVAVLVGAALLGIVGALVAIPISAALLLLGREILFPRLDQA